MPSGTKKIDRLREKGLAKWDKLTNEDFDSIKTDAAELATRLQARYGIAAEDAKRQAEQFMDEASEAVSDAYEQALDALDHAADKVDRMVKDNAWMTICGALLVGGVIGYLVGAEQRRRRW